MHIAIVDIAQSLIATMAIAFIASALFARLRVFR